MKEISKHNTILWLSLPLALLVTLAALVGLFTPGFYAKESPNWQAQSLGQDMVNLFLLVPALLISSWMAYRNRKAAIYAWAGIILYLLYTFIIYCFSVRFNQLFLVYCASLGLSFYSLLWFLYSQLGRKERAEDFSHTPGRLTGVYFIILALLFYSLWLAEILPAILCRQIPASVEETGLITNAVHVLDLSVFLPGIFITGLLLLKQRRAGYIMAPVLLSFFILMDITIGALVVIMKQRGVEADYSVTIIMAVLTLFSGLLLARYLRKIKLPPEYPG